MMRESKIAFCLYCYTFIKKNKRKRKKKQHEPFENGISQLLFIQNREWINNRRSYVYKCKKIEFKKKKQRCIPYDIIQFTFHSV